MLTIASSSSSSHVVMSAVGEGCKLEELEDSCSGKELGSEIVTLWSEYSGLPQSTDEARLKPSRMFR